MTGTTYEGGQMTAEEVTEVLDDADSVYSENKTFFTLLTKLNVYCTNIQPLSMNDKIIPLTRFLKIFTGGDVIAHNMICLHSNLRDIVSLKAAEIENVCGSSDLPEVVELLDQVENIKHIVDEIENDSDLCEFADSEEEIEDEIGQENQTVDDECSLTDSSDEEI